eukprot:36071-Chlamydomonas_euryale.AAC.6
MPAHARVCLLRADERERLHGVLACHCGKSMQQAWHELQGAGKKRGWGMGRGVERVSLPRPRRRAAPPQRFRGGWSMQASAVMARRARGKVA